MVFWFFHVRGIKIITPSGVLLTLGVVDSTDSLTLMDTVKGILTLQTLVWMLFRFSLRVFLLYCLISHSNGPNWCSSNPELSESFLHMSLYWRMQHPHYPWDSSPSVSLYRQTVCDCPRWPPFSSVTLFDSLQTFVQLTIIFLCSQTSFHHMERTRTQ